MDKRFRITIMYELRAENLMKVYQSAELEKLMREFAYNMEISEMTDQDDD